MNSRKPTAAALTFLLACAVPAAAADVLAVLSSGGGAYMDAFSGFQAAYGKETNVNNKLKVTSVQYPLPGLSVGSGCQGGEFTGCNFNGIEAVGYPGPLQG